jgi:UPF0271 protein
MNYQVDINCDVGEGIGNEAELMPYLSSCSIACGGHAGNDKTMIETIKLAQQHQVKMGAHPSFPDKKNFGRKSVSMPLADLQLSIENQINSVKNHILKLGGRLHHIKVHGALYNLSAIDSEIAKVVIEAFQKTAKGSFLYVPYHSVLQKMAEEKNIKIKKEAFADRNYNSDLTLVSRKKPMALITDEKKIVTHLLKMILEKKVIAVDGAAVKIVAETFCIHGDNPNAKNLLKILCKTLPENGIKIV